jgi:hypothetical protein
MRGVTKNVLLPPAKRWRECDVQDARRKEMNSFQTVRLRRNSSSFLCRVVS